MDFISFAFDFILHSDKYLASFVGLYGTWIYLFVFVLIFCETGLVVTPFLPGDSVLFALGSLASIGKLDPFFIAAIIFTAAFCGDNTNYFIGRRLGPAVFKKESSRFFKKEYLDRTHLFYEKYGPFAVIIARFMPIVRTFSPFVAGIGRMSYPRFLLFSVTGALLWVSLFVGAGFFFGSIPFVKSNFTFFILLIVFVSFVPPIIAVIRARSRKAVKSS
jgi:membrane-associated protein